MRAHPAQGALLDDSPTRRDASREAPARAQAPLRTLPDALLLEGKLALLSVADRPRAPSLARLARSPWIGLLLAILRCIVPLAIACARYFVRPIVRSLQAVSDGIVSMKDHDFSVSIAPAIAT